jgi:hypothetical protein
MLQPPMDADKRRIENQNAYPRSSALIGGPLPFSAAR